MTREQILDEAVRRGSTPESRLDIVGWGLMFHPTAVNFYYPTDLAKVIGRIRIERHKLLGLHTKPL